MKFVQDFKIGENKLTDEFKLNVKASFLLSYFDQISDKLNFSMEETENEETTTTEKDETTTTTVKVIRCTMDMIKPSSNLKIEKKQRSAKVYHSESTDNKEVQEVNK